MTLTEAQRNAIRSDARSIGMHIVTPDHDCNHDVSIESADVRALMRLGLCVVESGVRPEDFRVHAPTNETELEQEARVSRMLRAIAAEMEKNR